jgi:hypothetical protein
MKRKIMLVDNECRNFCIKHSKFKKLGETEGERKCERDVYLERKRALLREK